MKTISDVHVLEPCDVIDAEGIRQLADSYNLDEHEAPVVIGHPKDNGPAYGWVKSLTEKDGSLYANLEVQDSFFDMLKKQLFKKRSVSYYNSQPPVFRHLGFLGAQPPHVKGLQPLSLAESGAEVITLSEDLLEVKEKPMKELKPEVLYCLSEVLPGVTAKSFKTEPSQDDKGVISGIISLDDTEYSYLMWDDGQGNWKVDTEVNNSETIELAERVKTLEAQIARTSVSSEVEKIHEAKLTPKIISLDDCVDLVVNDGSGKLLQMLKNLPNIVDMSEAVPNTQDKDTETPLEFAKRLMANQ